MEREIKKLKIAIIILSIIIIVLICLLVFERVAIVQECDREINRIYFTSGDYRLGFRDAMIVIKKYVSEFWNLWW